MAPIPQSIMCWEINSRKSLLGVVERQEHGSRASSAVRQRAIEIIFISYLHVHITIATGRGGALPWIGALHIRTLVHADGHET